jgi:heptosyltransferase-1
VVEEGYVSLVRLNPHVRKIIPFALRRWRKSLGKANARRDQGFFRTCARRAVRLRVRHPGPAQDRHHHGRRARWCRAGKVGLANGSEGSGYEGISRIFHTRAFPLDPRTHAVARGRMVAGAALGYAVDTPPDFGLPAPMRARVRTGCRPSLCRVLPRHRARSPRSGRRPTGSPWASALAPMPVLLPGARRRKSGSRTLAAGCRTRACCPSCRWMDAVTLARNAALAIGVDTGLTHIAAAFVRPTVEIYATRRAGRPRATGRRASSTWATRARRRGGRGAGRPARACWRDLMRRFYSVMWWLALPLVLAPVVARPQGAGLPPALGERLGFYGASAPGATPSGCTRCRSAKRAPPNRWSTRCCAAYPTAASC